MAAKGRRCLLTVSLLAFSSHLVFFSNGVAGDLDRVTENDHLKEHYPDGHHDYKYDHELFLGKDAKTFDELPVEESKRRLRIIIDRMDEDSDGHISENELQNWIRLTQKRYIKDSAEQSWATYNVGSDQLLTWKQYSSSVYNYMKGLEGEDVIPQDTGKLTYQGLYERDHRRFKVADEDGDGKLSKQEFYAFLHPHESPKLQDVVVMETIESMDKDRDGKISLEEYKKDIFQGEPDQEPEWMKTEIDHFINYRDQNKDGYMDKDEVLNWIAPKEYDRAEAEARHLIHEADEDKDGRLSVDEIMNSYDVFVGSQATDYGESLVKHDEF